MYQIGIWHWYKIQGSLFSNNTKRNVWLSWLISNTSYIIDDIDILFEIRECFGSCFRRMFKQFWIDSLDSIIQELFFFLHYIWGKLKRKEKIFYFPLNFGNRSFLFILLFLYLFYFISFFFSFFILYVFFWESSMIEYFGNNFSFHISF